MAPSSRSGNMANSYGSWHVWTHSLQEPCGHNRMGQFHNKEKAVSPVLPVNMSKQKSQTSWFL